MDLATLKIQIVEPMKEVSARHLRNQNWTKIEPPEGLKVANLYKEKLCEIRAEVAQNIRVNSADGALFLELSANQTHAPGNLWL